jgi:hypothetical protein
MSRTLCDQIEAAGFTVLGGFVPDRRDDVPAVRSGQLTGYLALIGNAGPGMFEAFARARNPEHDQLDDWCMDVLGGLAAANSARAVYPWDRPYLPFQKWASKADAGRPSPLGMNIHPEYGLWYGLRAAFLLAEDPGLRQKHMHLDHPCDTCKYKPCLQACPVNAFTKDPRNPYAVTECVKYLRSNDGKTCLEQGCRARMACPVGKKHAYSARQIQFHLAAFYRARTKGCTT